MIGGIAEDYANRIRKCLKAAKADTPALDLNIDLLASAFSRLSML